MHQSSHSERAFIFEKYFGGSNHISLPIGAVECGDEVDKGLQSGFSSEPMSTSSLFKTF